MIDPAKVQAYIDRKSGGKSPLSAQFFIKLSADTGVPIELILAQAARESSFGTKGRAVRTKNMFNIGNYTEGDLYPAGHSKNTMNSNFMNSWEKGAYAYANTVKRDYLQNKTIDELLNRYTNNLDKRYAKDPNYETYLKEHIREMGNLQVNTPPMRNVAPNNNPFGYRNILDMPAQQPVYINELRNKKKSK